MVKIVDEQGRFFGLVNVIDLLVVLLVLSVAVAGVAIVTGGDTEKEQSSQESVILDVTVERVEPYVVDAIPAPRSTTDTDLRILDVSTAPALIIVNDSAGSPHVRDHPWLQTVDVRVEVMATRAGDTLQYNGNRLLVGRPVTLDLGTVVLEGDITNMTSAS